MNRQVVKLGTWIIKILSLVAGLSAYNNVIPEKYLPYAVLLFAVVSGAKDTLIWFLDRFDDGVVNQSVK